jgi:hypothetical protein
MPGRATLGWIITCVAIALDVCPLALYDATTNIGRYKEYLGSAVTAYRAKREAVVSSLAMPGPIADV